jgi:DNA polymerase III sliding clamp (beta) subunit (PCNA family)
MDFTIAADELQRAMKSLVVVARANALDATGRVLIEAEDNKVVFSANNNVTALTIECDKVEVSQPGQVSVLYTKIKSFIASFKAWNGKFGAKEFRFAGTDKHLNLTVDDIYENGKVSKGRLKLACYNPALIHKPDQFTEPTFILNSTVFRAAINKVQYAIDPNKDFDLFSLKGMNMSFDEDNIYFAGTDSRVLSEYQVKNTSDMTEGSITMEYEFVMGLRRLLADDIQLFWEISSNKIAVKFENCVYIGRLITGHEFPEYKEIFDNYTDRINLSKDLLLNSLNPFLDVLDAEDNYRLTFEIRDKVVRLFNDVASVEAEQDVIGGLDFTIDLNGKIFMQTIDAINDEHILLKFTDEGTPIIFDASTYEDQKALITPITKR